LILKTILATVLAGIFLVSVPLARAADEKAPEGEKAAKGKKDTKKDDKKKDEKAGGGW